MLVLQIQKSNSSLSIMDNEKWQESIAFGAIRAAYAYNKQNMNSSATGTMLLKYTEEIKGVRLHTDGKNEYVEIYGEGLPSVFFKMDDAFWLKNGKIPTPIPTDKMPKHKQVGVDILMACTTTDGEMTGKQMGYNHTNTQTPAFDSNGGINNDAKKTFAACLDSIKSQSSGKVAGNYKNGEIKQLEINGKKVPFLVQIATYNYKSNPKEDFFNSMKD